MATNILDEPTKVEGDYCVLYFTHEGNKELGS